jgi:GNAT superfamily N-acetyltransferase
VIVFGTRGIGAPCCRKRTRGASRNPRTGYCQAALSSDVRIRDARRDDVALMFGWIVELAEYERAPEQVTGTPELLEDALFGPAPCAEALIAEIREDAAAGATTRDGARAGAADWQSAGFALFHSTFSTWEARPGIWLEDLYVPPVHRRSGVGAALLAHLAGLTVARGCARLEWAALDWNEPALSFYDKIGARRLDDWILHRLDGAGLARVAGEAGAGD